MLDAASVRRRGEAGAVTAETAIVIPLLVLLAAGLAWVVGVAVAQVRCADAAREAARAVARGDAATAEELGTRVAPSGSQVTWRRDGGVVVVTVRSAVLGGWAGFVPRLNLEATAVAAVEPGVDDG